MATTGVFHCNKLIESLSVRGRPHQRANAFAPAEHAKAMAKRLAQLQAAMGVNEVGKAAEIGAKPAVTPSSRQFGALSLALTGLLSATLVGTTMWLIEAGEAPAIPPPPSIVSTSVTTPSPAALPGRAPSAGATEAVTPAVADETQIAELVETWRQAWSRHSVSDYLNAYGAQFTPADGGARESWEASRTKKLSTKADIDVQIRNIAMERIAPDLFKVSFQQDYKSGNYRETGRTKYLQVALEGGAWKIVREQLE